MVDTFISSFGPTLQDIFSETTENYTSNLVDILRFSSKIYYQEKFLHDNDKLQKLEPYMHIISFLSVSRNQDLAKISYITSYISKNQREIPEIYLYLGLESIQNIIRTQEFQEKPALNTFPTP